MLLVHCISDDMTSNYNTLFVFLMEKVLMLCNINNFPFCVNDNFVIGRNVSVYEITRARE